MASTDARPVPIKNTAYRHYFPIWDDDGDLVTGAAGLDSEVSIDGAAFSDCSNEATEIGSSGMYYLDLTSSEMNGDAIVVIVKTSTTGAKTTPIVLFPNETGDIDVEATVIAADAITASALNTNFTAELFGTALTEAYPTDGSTATVAQLLYLILAHLQESSISGTTKTIKKLDGTTTAATFTLDSATAPTSITRAT